jgi:hypothetical protein
MAHSNPQRAQSEEAQEPGTVKRPVDTAKVGNVEIAIWKTMARTAISTRRRRRRSATKTKKRAESGRTATATARSTSWFSPQPLRRQVRKSAICRSPEGQRGSATRLTFGESGEHEPSAPVFPIEKIESVSALIGTGHKTRLHDRV